MIPHLDPRDIFFGGRTNALCLHYKIQEEDETIQYDDKWMAQVDEDRCRQMEIYRKQCDPNEGVILDPSSISQNPVLRSLSKIQRLNMLRMSFMPSSEAQKFVKFI